jgi:hypothetical protein
MARRIVHDIVVPARHGRAVRVEKGQILRIRLVEGQQVGDCVFLNADDPREHFHAGQSWAMAVMLGTGDSRRLTQFFSQPPRENLMLSVVEDTVNAHFGACGGRCSTRLLARRDARAGPDVRSCQENLAEALAPHGIAPDALGDCFNVFMNVTLTPSGGFSIAPPETKAGDHIDLRAEMNILAAVSACPNETGPVNNFRAKPLGLTVFAAV